MTLVDYLIDSAKVYSDKQAIEIDGKSAPYGQLYADAYKMASYLQALGISGNVAVFLPKSFFLYKAIFSILLSGNCYVPLSCRSSKKQAMYIIKDSGVRCVITTVREIKRFFPHDVSKMELKENEPIIALLDDFNFSVIHIERLQEILDAQVLEKLVAVVVDETPSCLLYTSGTTGKPKGILHTHKSVSTFINWSCDFLNLMRSDRVAQKSSICFDLSLFEIFSTIKSGGTIIPVPEYLFNNGTLILNFIVNKRITVFYTVPSAILNARTSDFFNLISDSSLRHLIFAGEQLYTKYLKLLYEIMPDNCIFHNWYGPTETNVCAYFVITEDILSTSDVVPIGKACSYATLYLSDKNVLLISSASMMNCYWGGSIPDVIYVSGDIVFQDELKNFIYKGRVDRQVKFLGYRVQLEEIERVANSFIGVSESAVVVRDEICLFIETNQFFSDVKILLAFCRDALFSYMMPTLVYSVKEMPKTIRNKIDYAKLFDMVQHDMQ